MAGGRRCIAGEILPVVLDQKKFTEPVALLSTSPVNLRLPPTALGSGFDLLALRARCKRELRGSRPSRQALSQRNCRILRAANYPHFHGFCGWLGENAVDYARIRSKDPCVRQTCAGSSSPRSPSSASTLFWRC